MQALRWLDPMIYGMVKSALSYKPPFPRSIESWLVLWSLHNMKIHIDRLRHGSLSWMYVFSRTRIRLKTWAYSFLVVQLVCIVWGCLGISNNIPIGFKHSAEFWVEQVLFMSTSSALRALNRVMFSSMLPKGSEAIFFGLEIVLDLSTGWINPLVQGVIQNNTRSWYW